MSSFEQPHSLFLFELTSGKKKLLYGASPEHALETARIRLSEEERKELEEPYRPHRVMGHE